jgi:hypothetical protein
MGIDAQDLVEGAASGYMSEEAVKRVQQMQDDLQADGRTIGLEAAGMANFQPYTVTSTLGGATVGPDGSVNLTTTEEERALSAGLLGGAGGAFNRAMADPAVAQEELYNQMRAIQQPEEQRQRLALEQRMFNQGRMGVSSAAYGGANPEMLAQEQAIQENMLKANLAARGQSMQELGQYTDMGTSMLAGAYTPQAQALGLLGAGTNVAQIADLGRRTGAGLFSDISQKYVDPYTKMLGLELDAKAARDAGYFSLFYG